MYRNLHLHGLVVSLPVNSISHSVILSLMILFLFCIPNRRKPGNHVHFLCANIDIFFLFSCVLFLDFFISPPVKHCPTSYSIVTHGSKKGYIPKSPSNGPQKACARHKALDIHSFSHFFSPPWEVRSVRGNTFYHVYTHE